MPDAPLCPKCKIPVVVYADGSLMCERCLTMWPSEADLKANAPRPSDEAKKLLARAERGDANAHIREIMAELDVLSPEQFAVKRKELCERYGITKAELNGFYQKAHGGKKAPAPEHEAAPREATEEPEDLPFNILGTANDGLTYFIDRSERLCTLRLGGLTKTQLFLLADRDWWEGIFAGARGRMDLDGAINYLIKAANGKSFDSDRLRGRGCWREE